MSVLRNAADPEVEGFGDFAVDPEAIRIIPEDEIPTELPTSSTEDPTGTCTNLFMKLRY